MKQTKRQKTLLIVNVAAIFVIMGAIALFMTFGERPKVSLVENRDLAKCPEFTWESYFSGDFTHDFAAYYNDTVPARKEFKLFISEFRARLGIDYDGGVNIYGGKPDMSDNSKPDTSKTESGNKVPDVVLPDTPKVPEVVLPD